MKQYYARDIAEIMQVKQEAVRQWVRFGFLECMHDHVWIVVPKKWFRRFMRNNARAMHDHTKMKVND